MARLMNRMTGIGYLGGDPVVKEVSRGKEVLNVSVALDNGDDYETTWIQLAVWNPDQINMYMDVLKKGMQVYFEGQLLPARAYENRDKEMAASNSVMAWKIIWFTPREESSGQSRSSGQRGGGQSRSSGGGQRRSSGGNQGNQGNQDGGYDESEAIPF